MSVLSIIVAMDEHRAIGKDQQLLWRLPHDMQRFKEITTGHTVIMGRKTYESLPKGALPNRKNIVLTQRFAEADYAGCLVYPTLQSALAACEDDREVFIIGGASVYRQVMAIADILYLTTVHHTFAGADTFFPLIDASEWMETDRQDFPEDDKNPYLHSFSTYIRKNKRLGDTTLKN
jgi:dihydrofolate reductase